MKKVLVALSILITSSCALAADLAPSCDEYFKEIDNYLEAVGKNKATQSNLEMVRSQYEEAKKQMELMPKEVQQQACTQGATALKQAIAAMPK